MTKKTTAPRCPSGKCPRKGHYLMRWTDSDGRLREGLLCGVHDHALGQQNLQQLCGLSKVDAIDLDALLTGCRMGKNVSHQPSERVLQMADDRQPVVV